MKLRGPRSSCLLLCVSFVYASLPRQSTVSRATHARGVECGGAEEARTPDPLLAKEVLSQLSYGPMVGMLEAGSPAPASSLHSPAVGGAFWTRTRDLSLIRTAL